MNIFILENNIVQQYHIEMIIKEILEEHQL